MPGPMNLRLLDHLKHTATDVVQQLHADACAISRAIGEVLILVTEASGGEPFLRLGAGYLVSDYPVTKAVLTTGRPRALTLEDPDADPAETALLRELGYASLALLPFDLQGQRWGLVEVYRHEPRPFDEIDLRLAEQVIARASAAVGSA